VEHITGDFIPSLRGALKDLATWVLCSKMFCGHRDNLSLTYTIFRPKLGGTGAVCMRIYNEMGVSVAERVERRASLLQTQSFDQTRGGASGTIIREREMRDLRLSLLLPFPWPLFVASVLLDERGYYSER